MWYYSRFRSLTDTVQTGLSDRTEDEAPIEEADDDGGDSGGSISPSIGGRTSSLSLFALESSHPSHFESSTDLSCSYWSCESSLLVQTLPHEPPGDPTHAEEDRRRSRPNLVPPPGGEATEPLAGGVLVPARPSGAVRRSAGPPSRERDTSRSSSGGRIESCG